MRTIFLLKAKLKTPTFTGFKLQGRRKFQGMDISIENRAGSIRSGTGENGKKWKTKMIVPYGYILGSIGVDGEGNKRDHVDCFIGHNPDSQKVIIIHQVVPETGEFDEDKVMLGFDGPHEAIDMYMRHYDKPDYFGSYSEMDIDEFKTKIFGAKKGKKII